MPKLTRLDAERRGALLSVSRYRCEVDLTLGAECFRSTTSVEFACREPAAATFIELASGDIESAILNGHPLPPGPRVDNQIQLTGLHASNQLSVSAVLPYSTSAEGLYRFIDPADGAAYVGAYCGVDLAQQVFACFNQPDLKARFEVTVRAPAGWSVVANGRLLGNQDGLWRFATTPPISTYLFTLVAGPLYSLTAEHRGLPLGLHCRSSLREQLDTHAGELFSLTTAYLDRYADIFDEPYPFDSYDQAFVPGLNWGALENPGCVTFRDEFLFRHHPTYPERLRRATVIAHEMAHMWFGDLVTMAWWDDIWLSESFAEYMGFQVTTECTAYADAWVEFSITTKPWGYDSDQRPSTHPVAPEPGSVVDTDAAMANFDGISYAKGAAALRQLVAWVGPVAFFAGLNDFLTGHRFGCASAGDLYQALATASGRDVPGWAATWLRTTGVDTLHVTDGALVHEGGRPHRLTILTSETGGINQMRRELDIAAGDREIPLGGDPVLLLNAEDRTYAKLRLDRWDELTGRLHELGDPLARSVVWTVARDRARDAELPVGAYLDLAERQLPYEDNPSIVHAVLSFARQDVTDIYVRPAERGAVLDRITALCLRLTTAGERGRLVGRILLASSSSADDLRGWLAEAVLPGGLALDRDLRWRLVLRLCVLGLAGADLVESELSADPTSTGHENATRCRAAIPDPDAKRRAWETLVGPRTSTRIMQAVGQGLWQAGHAELLGDLVRDYFPAAGLAARRGAAPAKVLGEAAFPSFAVDAAPTLAEYLAANEPPAMLRRGFTDRLDDLERAARVRARQGP